MGAFDLNTFLAAAAIRFSSFIGFDSIAQAGGEARNPGLAPDLRISRVITGLWQIADMERDGRSVDLDSAARSMQAYIDAGLTTFDMADHYGSSEEIAGRFSKSGAAGDNLQLLTKWVPQPGGADRATVRAAVHRALDRLQADKLQLLQYHAWNYADPSYLDDLAYLKELQEEGLIAHLGLTNFDTAHLRVVLESGIDIVSNQVCFSLLDQRAAGDMLALCAERNVKLLAFGTLAGGFLSERWLRCEEPDDATLTTWSQMKYKRYIDEAGGWAKFQALLEALADVGEQHGVTVANVASRFILEQPAVGAVIIGARLGQSEHIDSLPAPYPCKTGSDGQTLALSGTIWEDLAGFSRAVRKGDTIYVSGTTATHNDRVIGHGDPIAQTHYVIDKIEGALQSLGGSIENVVRTRIFVRDMADWEAVARVHGQRFAAVQPANTLVRAELVGDEYLVEIEAQAVIAPAGTP